MSTIMLVAQAATTAPGADTTAGQAAKAAGDAGNAAGAAATHAAIEVPGGASVGFPPFDASTFGSQILWLVICFGALYLIVSRVAVPRVSGILSTRRGKIDGDLAEADRLRKQTDQAIADYEAALAAARAKAHAIAEETRAASKAKLDGKRAEVEADLAQKVGAAEASIQKAKTEALGKVDDIATDTAAALVERLTGGASPEAVRAAVASVKR